MRFLVDAQLPPALALLLGEHGHLAEHITDIGPADAPDRDLWQYALEHEAVISADAGSRADLLPHVRNLRDGYDIDAAAKLVGNTVLERV